MQPVGIRGSITVGPISKPRDGGHRGALSWVLVYRSGCLFIAGAAWHRLVMGAGWIGVLDGSA